MHPAILWVLCSAWEGSLKRLGRSDSDAAEPCETVGTGQELLRQHDQNISTAIILAMHNSNHPFVDLFDHTPRGSSSTLPLRQRGAVTTNRSLAAAARVQASYRLKAPLHDTSGYRLSCTSTGAPLVEFVATPELSADGDSDASFTTTSSERSPEECFL